MKIKAIFLKNISEGSSREKQSGQILIIFLLVLVVGLAIVLSVASRSITDIRTTTTSDESNRAYFAAEAGVEEALKRIEADATAFTTSLDFTSLNQTTAKVSAGPIDLGSVAFAQKEVQKDDVMQVSLLNDFNDLGSSSPIDPVPDDGQLWVYWGEVGAATTPAVEVTIVYCTSCSSPNPVFKLRKFAFDPDGSRRPLNNFCEPVGVSSGIESTNVGNIDFKYKLSVKIREGYLAAGTECGTDVEGISNGTTPVLGRIRLLYNVDDPQPVGVRGGGAPGWGLPGQGIEIESTGTTVSGVTRKLKVIRQFPALPAIFDYVLFSGTDLEKN